MAEQVDKESQTEEATEKRIRTALEEGNVPITREASIFASLAGILIISAFILKDRAAQVVATLARLIDDPGGLPLANGADAVAVVVAVLRETGLFMTPIFVILIVTGLTASAAQNVPRVVLSRIMPDFSRVSPRSGWSRIFGRQGQIEFLKGLFKFAAVGLVVFTILRSEKDTFQNAMITEPEALPSLIMGIGIRLLAAICIAAFLLVAGDLVWARLRWRMQLRMSRREIKDEMKQLEGDPLSKARRRSFALDRSRKRMIAAVPKATLVIVNPTHYAIALRYVREEGGAPLVLAKGQDLIALKIREIAEENLIPIVEDKALARSMYDNVEVDRMIPPEFYRAVAEVIHFLYAKAPRATAAK
jgi:flagellar biosynthetic protein FlhB